jgi:hypothetical protein
MINSDHHAASSRRRFLAAVGLGSASPILQSLATSLAPEARAQTAAKAFKRVFFYVDLLGVPAEYRPKALGGETQFDLGAYTALEPLKDKITVVSGFYNPFDLHLHGNRWPLSVAKGIGADIDTIAPGGISIDRHIAQGIGKDDPFPSLNLFAWPGAADGFRTGHSADGAEKPYPGIVDFVSGFQQVFGNIAAPAPGGPSGPSPALVRDRELLDFVADDVGRLRARLAAPEREKLDQMLDSTARLQQKVQRLAAVGGGCQKPAAPEPRINTGGKRGEAVIPERMTTALDFVASAFACGLTHVATLQMSAASLAFLGDPTIGVHTLWHGGAATSHRAYYKYVSENLAYFWNKLAAFSDGAGTLADSSLVVWLNASGGIHHNGSYDYWSMLIGSGGPFRGGRYLEMPSSPMAATDPRSPLNDPMRGPRPGRPAPNLCTSDLFVSVARALGMNTTTFGDPRYCRGPVAML